MRRLFVSYPREYRPIVDRLVLDLRKSGFEPYFDEELAGGQDWWNELMSHIEKAGAFVPIVGPEYLSSRPCDLEAYYAAALGKPVLPIEVETVSAALFSETIASAQWVKYDPEEPDSLFGVIRAINGMKPPRKLPDPMPERPIVPISYLSSVRNEIAGDAEIGRLRQLEIIADLRGQLETDDRDAAIHLLKALRQRPDVGYQAALDIDEVLKDGDDQDVVKKPWAWLGPLRRRWRQIATATLLVAAGVTFIATIGGADAPETDLTDSPSAPPITSTDSPSTPPSTTIGSVTCWEGTVIDDDGTCPPLAGEDAMTWAFPLLKGPADEPYECEDREKTYNEKEAKTCRWDDLENSEIVLRSWESSDDAVNAYRESKLDYTEAKFKVDDEVMGTSFILEMEPRPKGFYSAIVYIYRDVPISSSSLTRGTDADEIRKELELVGNRQRAMGMADIGPTADHLG